MREAEAVMLKIDEKKSRRSDGRTDPLIESLERNKNQKGHFGHFRINLKKKVGYMTISHVRVGAVMPKNQRKSVTDRRTGPTPRKGVTDGPTDEPSIEMRGRP